MLAPPLQFTAPPTALPHVYPPPATIPIVSSLPQYQQAQQLFQRDAQTITPEALKSVKAALASSEVEHKAETKKKAVPRKAAGQSWEDRTLADWPESGLQNVINFGMYFSLEIKLKEAVPAKDKYFKALCACSKHNKECIEEIVKLKDEIKKI
ncbi:hypothetical protein ACH5RR_019137 [Cinchona calisaya]|uniref:Uncharacterized protein n=1 Tax=Cinchona calisaya TaxID=153742 RepID=A0ABD2ZPS3_9GENT